jgi:hypothetical protein
MQTAGRSVRQGNYRERNSGSASRLQKNKQRE